MSDTRPIPPQVVERALEQADATVKRAIGHAAGRDIDAQQVAVQRIADLATKLRAARDLLAYASQAGPSYHEPAAVFAGQVAAHAVNDLAGFLGGDDCPDGEVYLLKNAGDGVL